jgi:hypothetical protein
MDRFPLNDEPADSSSSATAGLGFAGPDQALARGDSGSSVSAESEGEGEGEDGAYDDSARILETLGLLAEGDDVVDEDDKLLSDIELLDQLFSGIEIEEDVEASRARSGDFTVFVGNLAFATTEGDLRQLCEVEGLRCAILIFFIEDFRRLFSKHYSQVLLLFSFFAPLRL